MIKLFLLPFFVLIAHGCIASDSYSYDLASFEKKSLGLELSKDEIKKIFFEIKQKYGNTTQLFQTKILPAAKDRISIEQEIIDDLGNFYLNRVIAAKDEDTLVIIEFLLNNGIDPYLPDNYGVIPIVNSVFLENKQAFNLLKQSRYKEEHIELHKKILEYANAVEREWGIRDQSKPTP